MRVMRYAAQARLEKNTEPKGRADLDPRLLHRLRLLAMTFNVVIASEAKQPDLEHRTLIQSDLILLYCAGATVIRNFIELPSFAEKYFGLPLIGVRFNQPTILCCAKKCDGTQSPSAKFWSAGLPFTIHEVESRRDHHRRASESPSTRHVCEHHKPQCSRPDELRINERGQD